MILGLVLKLLQIRDSIRVSHDNTPHTCCMIDIHPTDIKLQNRFSPLLWAGLIDCKVDTDTVSTDTISDVTNNAHKVNDLQVNIESINSNNQVDFISSVDIVRQVKQGKGNSYMHETGRSTQK